MDSKSGSWIMEMTTSLWYPVVWRKVSKIERGSMHSFTYEYETTHNTFPCKSCQETRRVIKSEKYGIITLKPKNLIESTTKKEALEARDEPIWRRKDRNPQCWNGTDVPIPTTKHMYYIVLRKCNYTFTGKLRKGHWYVAWTIDALMLWPVPNPIFAFL